MSIRRLYYLACTKCNDQFRSQHGAHFGESAQEVLDQARKEGWRRKLVENGTMWDFCPRCLLRHMGCKVGDID